MLVLSRKTAERIHIGDEIVLTVLSMKGGRVRLGISAPRDVVIRRSELESRIESNDEEMLTQRAAVRLPR